VVLAIEEVSFSRKHSLSRGSTKILLIPIRVRTNSGIDCETQGGMGMVTIGIHVHGKARP
jgi:hypothetical protein